MQEIMKFELYQLEELKKLRDMLNSLIKEKERNMSSTIKQRKAVMFTQQFVEEEFKGDITNFRDCHNYLSRNLENAKVIAEDVMSSWSADI